MLLSESVHVTHSAVVGYLELDKDLQTTLRKSPRELIPRPEHVLYASAMASMLCVSVLARVTADAELQARLDKVSDELVLPVVLDLADDSESVLGASTREDPSL
ncbi:hypothetical protein [Herbiconiux solani]|uniref:hypothetical protein n=1 Tax=Herbiconiux solani TaxID=661329 RepID=UPI0008249CE9|nr:hypothetical protein [Herbiconiux solani]